MTRANLIRDRLVAHFHETLQVSTTLVLPDYWWNLDLIPQYRYGWTPPFVVEMRDRPRMGVLLCPEVIGEVTAHLDERDLDAYITIIELTAATYLRMWDSPPEAVEDELLDLLWQAAPTALVLRTDVELHALDTGIVPVTQSGDG